MDTEITLRYHVNPMRVGPRGETVMTFFNRIPRCCRALTDKITTVTVLDNDARLLFGITIQMGMAATHFKTVARSSTPNTVANSLDCDDTDSQIHLSG